MADLEDHDADASAHSAEIFEVAADAPWEGDSSEQMEQAHVSDQNEQVLPVPTCFVCTIQVLCTCMHVYAYVYALHVHYVVYARLTSGALRLGKRLLRSTTITTSVPWSPRMRCMRWRWAQSSNCSAPK